MLDHDGLADTRVRHEARDGEATAHVRPLGLGRGSARPAAAPSDPIAEKVTLVEELDAHPAERRRHDLDDIRVGHRAGLRLHPGECGIQPALVEQVRLPELTREGDGADALGLEGGQHGARFVDFARERAIGLIAHAGRLAEGERDHAPPVASRLAGHARRQHAGAAYQAE